MAHEGQSRQVAVLLDGFLKHFVKRDFRVFDTVRNSRLVTFLTRFVPYDLLLMIKVTTWFSLSGLSSTASPPLAQQYRVPVIIE